MDWREPRCIKPASKIEEDFAVARYLMPNREDVALNEGLFWLHADDEELAFSLWEDSMRRWPDNAAVLYRDIFSAVRQDVELRERWRQLGHVNPQCLPILLQNVDPTEFRIELNRLLTEDPDLKSLSSQERKILFATWLHEGDQLALADALQRHPDWQTDGWQELAEALANSGDYRPAYETVLHFVSRPTLPAIPPNDNTKTLLFRFRATKNIATRRPRAGSIADQRQ